MIDPRLAEDAPVVTGTTLRQFAALSVVFFGGLAYWNGVVQHQRVTGAVLAAVAVGLGAAGLARPEMIRPIFTILLVGTAPVGRVVSVILLAGLFYLVFTPLGLMFRLFGRDALHIRRPNRPSHWKVKPAVTDLRSYTRQ